jgi:hypothetical protein
MSTLPKRRPKNISPSLIIAEALEFGNQHGWKKNTPNVDRSFFRGSAP